MEAAKHFFQQAVGVVGHIPNQVTTDGHVSYPRARRETMSSNTQHRTNKYRGNLLEQDHRGMKQRSYPMHGFKTVEAAARFCCDARRIAQLSPSAPYRGKVVSLLEQRPSFLQHLATLQTMIQAAS